MSELILRKPNWRKLIQDISLNNFNDKNRTPRNKGIKDFNKSFITQGWTGESSHGGELRRGWVLSRKRTIRKCKLN